jgi:hypothetical protein
MSGYRNFDVIFSTTTLQSSTELRDILRDQESGSVPYVNEVTSRVLDLRERIRAAVGPGFEVAFGLNTTSSVSLMLPLLPRALVAGTKEFPPIVRALDAFGKRWAGFLDCENGRFLPAPDPPAPEDDGYLLLLSHVAYTDGEDVLGGGLDAALADAPWLRDHPVHLVVDGVHALCNHFSLTGLPELRRRCAEALPLAGFTYVFDFHKWVQGVMGMAVVVTTDPRLPRTLDWVFPNTLTFDGPAVRFQPPESVSFNPALVYWLLNMRHFADVLFDDGLPARNAALTAAFLDRFVETPCVRLGRHRDNNLLALETGQPVELHRHLDALGFRTHLIGGRELRTAHGPVALDGCVRVAFRDGLVDRDDVAAFADALPAWSPLPAAPSGVSP